MPSRKYFLYRFCIRILSSFFFNGLCLAKEVVTFFRETEKVRTFFFFRKEKILSGILGKATPHTKNVLLRLCSMCFFRLNYILSLIPILFNVAINEVLSAISPLVSTSISVDDLALLVTCDSPASDHLFLQETLNTIFHWLALRMCYTYQIIWNIDIFLSLTILYQNTLYPVPQVGASDVPMIRIK